MAIVLIMAVGDSQLHDKLVGLNHDILLFHMAIVTLPLGICQCDFF